MPAQAPGFELEWPNSHRCGGEIPAQPRYGAIATRCHPQPLPKAPRRATCPEGSLRPFWGAPALPPHPLQHQWGPNCTTASASSRFCGNPLAAASSQRAGPQDAAHAQHGPTWPALMVLLLNSFMGRNHLSLKFSSTWRPAVQTF